MNQLISLVPREKRMMYELKRHTPIHEWKQLQKMMGEMLGLNEAEAVTDQQVEDLILQVAKDLKAAGKIEKVPADIDIDKLEKGDESGIQMSESKRQINESLGMTLLLAAPSLLKLLGKIVDWIFRTLTLSGAEKDQWEEQKAAFDYAKKTGKTIDGKPVSEDDIHHMEDAIYKSKFGKGINWLSHKLHDGYITPLRLVIAGAMYIYDNENEKGQVSWKQAWKDSKKPANIIYAVFMFIYAGYSGIKAVTHVVDLPVAQLEPIAHIVADTIKGGDMSMVLLKKVLGHAFA